MKILYLCVLLILTLIMIGMTHQARKKNNDLLHALVRMSNTVAVVTVTYGLAICVPSDSVALFLQTMHYAATEWMLIFALSFLELYTGQKHENYLYKVIVIKVGVVSSLCMLLNVFFGHVVTCTTTYPNGRLMRVFTTGGVGYMVHMALCILLALTCFLILINAVASAASVYKVKYYPVLVAFICTFALETISQVLSTELDYALYGYVSLTITMVYYSVYHVFKGLITKTLSYVASESQNGVLCLDVYGKCLYANDIMWKLFPEVNKLEDFAALFTHSTDEEEKTDEVTRWTLERGNGDNKQYFEVTFGSITDTKDEAVGSYYSIYDNTENVREYEKARYMATHDQLTGLYNSGSFYINVNDWFNSGGLEEEGAYLVASDIKDFKLVNDLFGFEKGNELLSSFAQFAVEEFSDKAICSRINSDRFAFVIPKSEYSEDKFVHAVSRLSEVMEEENYNVILHFGVVEIADTSIPPHVLYDRARIALLLIKNEYDKTFSYYDDTMMRQLVREKELVGEFDKALEEKQFLMFLQPQMSVDGEMVGAEALVRWKHPEQGMISPGEFITTFEKASLIHKLDKYMWELAADKLREWQSQGRSDYHISVNISPRDFYYLDVYQTLVDIVTDYKIEPSKLRLEITESAFMIDPEKQLELIAKLQGYGFIVEIDDFGSGYSSLNMLKDMKANVVKIDMGFLRKTEDVDRAKLIIEVVVQLAKKLDMLVITEGVETQGQVDYLTSIGCDVIQGYYFSKPIEVAEYENKYFK